MHVVYIDNLDLNFLTRTLAQCSVGMVEFVINFDCEFVCFKLTRTHPDKSIYSPFNHN